MKIYVRLEAPFEWVRVAGAAVEAFGEVPSLADYPITADDEVIGVVPGEWVTTHLVNLPTKTRKQFNQALPFALEDTISEEISNIHFSCPDWKPATEVAVLSVAKDKMKSWQDLANDHRLPIAQLLPEYALLPYHEAADSSIALSERAVFACNSDLGGVSIDDSLIDVWLMDIPMTSTIAVNDEVLTQKLIAEHPSRDFRHWPFGEKMRHWLEYDVKSAVDLWGDVYRPSVSQLSLSTLIRPLFLVLIALGLYVGYDVYRYFSLTKEINHLENQMVEMLGETFPEAQGITGDGARGFMEAAISRGQARANEKSVHSAMADAAKVLKSMRASLLEISYQNEELVLTCVLNDFSQVDALSRQFNARKFLSASLQGSSAEDGKVLATYSIRQR